MSNKIKGKMILFGCGGAGINIVGSLNGHLSKLGSGFAEIKVEYLDASDANVKNFKHDENNFHHIKSLNVGEDISGSAGERRENAPHIIRGVTDFINKKNYSDKDLATYYVVIYSASGGSGSMIGPFLYKHLADKGLPVIAVVVGDSSSGQYINNTIGGLASLNGIANNTGKPVSVIYKDNCHSEGETIKEKKDNTDKYIFKALAGISAFISGDASELDQKDMTNFFDQSGYFKNPEMKEDIPVGLYHISLFNGKVELPEHVNVTGVRTLSPIDVSPSLDFQPPHIKHGDTDNQNVIDIFKESLPLYLVTYTNHFSFIEMGLKDAREKIKNRTTKFTVDNVTALDTSIQDDSGIVY